MYSDDEDPFGGGAAAARSPTPPSRHRPDAAPGGAGEQRGPRQGGGAGAGAGSRPSTRQRTTGRELPKLHSIHRGVIASVQTYGAFVRLGDGGLYKDGLLHISRLSTSGRVERVEDVVSKDDKVWVKVVEVKEEEGKFSLDMRHVSQQDGEDKDPNNLQVDAGGPGRGGAKPQPIRIGAVQDMTCSRCGARGHGPRECFAVGGKTYELVEELPEDRPPRDDGPPRLPAGQEKAVKEVLSEYLRSKNKRALDGKSSSSSSSSGASSSQKKKKQKKQKKKEKKEEKKRKKEEKKAKKKLKKAAKAAAKEKEEKAPKKARLERA